MTKTMSIRMDQDNFDFLNKLSKEESGDVSKAVRELVNKGRLHACRRAVQEESGFPRLTSNESNF